MAIANYNGAIVDAVYMAGGYVKNFVEADGIYTVPDGESHEVLNARAIITTTATAGNRTFTLRVLTSGGGVAYAATATSNLAASQTNAVRETTLSSPFYAGAGSTVNFTDTAGIDAADTRSVVFTVRVFPSPQ